MRKSLIVLALTAVLTGGTTTAAFAADAATTVKPAAVTVTATDTNGNDKPSDKTGLWGLLGLLGLAGLAKRKVNDADTVNANRR